MTSAMSATLDEDVATVVRTAAAPLRALEGRVVLVAGAAGFLPSMVVDAIARHNDETEGEPCRVVAVDNHVTGTVGRLGHLAGRDDVELVGHDLVEPLPFDHPVDHVLHAASIASPTWYRRKPLETIDVNVTGTRNLLDFAVAVRARTFVYVSSSEIYGDPPPDRIPTSEDYWGHVSSTGPRACYDESKRLAETLVTTYNRVHGLSGRLARPFNVYGPGLRLDDGRIVPDLVRAAVAGEPLVLHSDGRPTRSFCYVTDAAAGLLHLLADDVPPGPYNLGNPEEVSMRDTAQIVADLAGGLEVRTEDSDDPEYLADNPKRRCPDIGRLAEATGWRPRVGLREGLGRTLAHYKELAEAPTEALA